MRRFLSSLLKSNISTVVTVGLAASLLAGCSRAKDIKPLEWERDEASFKGSPVIVVTLRVPSARIGGDVDPDAGLRLIRADRFQLVLSDGQSLRPVAMGVEGQRLALGLLEVILRNRTGGSDEIVELGFPGEHEGEGVGPPFSIQLDDDKPVVVP